MKFIGVCFWILLVAGTCAAQTGAVNVPAGQMSPAQTAAMEEIVRLDQELSSFFEQKKFDEAIALAPRIRELIEQHRLGEDPRSLNALVNIGETYLNRNNEVEAIALFDQVIGTYRRTLGANSAPEAALTKRIAIAFSLVSNFKQTAEYFYRLRDILAAVYPQGSAETVEVYNMLGNLYRHVEWHELASKAYLIAIGINDRILDEQQRQDRTDVNRYACYQYRLGYERGRITEASPMVDQVYRSRPPTAADVADNFTEIGVIRAGAVKLKKPEYPRGGLKGFAIVRIEVDESGHVKKATSICGMNTFFAASELAAKETKFSSTVVGGRTRKVRATIVYMFGGTSGRP